MIKIIAASFEDGWAVIIDNNEAFLLRPPYIKSNIRKISKDAIENLIRKQGYTKLDINLKNILEVVKFLKEKYVENKEKKGIIPLEKKELGKALRYADKDTILWLIDKANKELMPQGYFEAAEDLIFDLKKQECIRQDIRLQADLLESLERIHTERNRGRDIVNGINELERNRNWKKNFPNAVASFTLKSLVAKQESIIRFGHIYDINTGRGI